VLPLVLGRFQSALATATAMHQLPTSISALALCVRPLLLAGWHTKEESTQQVCVALWLCCMQGSCPTACLAGCSQLSTYLVVSGLCCNCDMTIMFLRFASSPAGFFTCMHLHHLPPNPHSACCLNLTLLLQPCQVIAEAMMAVLPGIDANDEAKTAAVFQFYTAVLSSIPALHGAAEEEDAAPVYGSAEGGSSSMDGVEYGGGGAASAGNGNGRNAPVYRLPLYLDDWVDQVGDGCTAGYSLSGQATMHMASGFPPLCMCQCSCCLPVV
jgi:hypothetical protein